MIRDIRRRYFEIWGDEQSQNVVLKYLILVLAVLLIVAIVAFSIVAFRKPILIGVNQTTTEVLKVTPPADELLKTELDRVLRKYIESHYTWNHESIEKSLDAAAKYVIDKNRKSFFASNVDEIRFAKEKKVSQRSHIVDIQIDTKSKAARIRFDRILVVDGLNAVTTLTLDIGFVFGERDSSNPEGVYIASEKLIQGGA